jgi:hypothetical protein
MSRVEDTLQQRANCYGPGFLGLSVVIQRLKTEMRESRNWDSLDDDQREALEMIAVKIGRILYGDPRHIDSWHDIAGYAKLVEDRLAKEPDGTR